jgi:hypothetical protein
MRLNHHANRIPKPIVKIGDGQFILYPQIRDSLMKIHNISLGGGFIPGVEVPCSGTFSPLGPSASVTPVSATIVLFVFIVGSNLAVTHAFQRVRNNFPISKAQQTDDLSLNLHSHARTK